MRFSQRHRQYRVPLGQRIQPGRPCRSFKSRNTSSIGLVRPASISASPSSIAARSASGAATPNRSKTSRDIKTYSGPATNPSCEERARSCSGVNSGTVFCIVPHFTLRRWWESNRIAPALKPGTQPHLTRHNPQPARVDNLPDRRRLALQLRYCRHQVRRIDIVGVLLALQSFGE